MLIMRLVLLSISALTIAVLLVFWVISGRYSDLILLFILAFLVANTVYIYVSRPALRTSDILARASTGFAIAALELQHQTQEARTREVETEKRRLAGVDHNQYKLQVAKDMLEQLRLKLLLDRKGEATVPQIAFQARSEAGALQASSPTLSAEGGARLANGHGALTEPTRPVAQTSAVRSPSILN